MPIARSIRVTGHVQGAFFREWTIEIAGGLGVAGWVRNRSDDSVEVYALGEAEQVGSFIDQLREGSPASRVDEVGPAEVERIARFVRRASV